MIQCPECRKMIPDDSAYCDQCGKELKWCPQCKRPKRGTECPLCGSVLVPGRQYLGGGLGVSGGSGASGGVSGGSGASGGSGVSGASGASGVSGGSGVSGASGGAAGGLGSSGGASRGGSGGAAGGFGSSGGASRGGAPFGSTAGASGVGIVPTALVGNGWRLILQEGPFGRTGGIWPELASCRYVSGNHGRISKTAAGWQVEDCGSTNGTFVNGVRIQKQILKRGDILRIATLDFTID
ncbi:MAG: FHA domain-containing protein [Candidatus Cryptobacteroides sp.]